MKQGELLQGTHTDTLLSIILNKSNYVLDVFGQCFVVLKLFTGDNYRGIGTTLH